MMMTVDAYTSLFGNFSGYFIAISVLLFGLATVLCWAHYGIVSVKYLSSRRFVIPIFIAVYSTAICLGSVLSADIIWDGADLSIGIMTFINVAILIKLSGEVKRETESYFGKRKKRDKE
jgi:AGCS family alanine or glycine:cation symporter